MQYYTSEPTPAYFFAMRSPFFVLLTAAVAPLGVQVFAGALELDCECVLLISSRIWYYDDG